MLKSPASRKQMTSIMQLSPEARVKEFLETRRSYFYLETRGEGGRGAIPLSKRLPYYSTGTELGRFRRQGDNIYDMKRPKLTSHRMNKSPGWASYSRTCISSPAQPRTPCTPGSSSGTRSGRSTATGWGTCTAAAWRRSSTSAPLWPSPRRRGRASGFPWASPER
jgi:hypothetical protein